MNTKYANIGIIVLNIMDLLTNTGLKNVDIIFVNMFWRIQYDNMFEV